jgi:quinol monooxygenase YgiN
MRWHRDYGYAFGLLSYDKNMKVIKILAALVFVLLVWQPASAQDSKQMVRLANLVIDSAQLNSYHAFLKEEIKTSIQVEPGVLTLYAVAEKNRPTHITILEIYASADAYQKHIQTPHFLKYKNGTKDMVKSLELVEAVPLIPDMKIK